jgi:hypothetical protein
MDAVAGRPDWLKITCRYTPTQLEGTTPEGAYVYFRYRWGVATLDIDGTQIWSEEYGDQYGGVMDTDLAAALVTTQLGIHQGDPLAQALYDVAHAFARAALPVAPARPLTDAEQALLDRWTATTPPAQD